MANERIIVVDDEEDILELIEYNLSKERLQVECVTTGEATLESVRTKQPDLVILDLMLPGIDGLEVCKTLKSDPLTSHIPIIMLTAKGEDADIVTGLELGADDYITKPFSPRVLTARIKAVLRRGRKVVDEQQMIITKGALVINIASHEVLVNDKQIELTPTEFDILLYMIRRPGWVCSPAIRSSMRSRETITPSRNGQSMYRLSACARS